MYLSKESRDFSAWLSLKIVTQTEFFSVLIVNKCPELSPDLLCLSNVELSTVTSSLLISFLQHGGDRPCQDWSPDRHEAQFKCLDPPGSSSSSVCFRGGGAGQGRVLGMTLCIKVPECIREEGLDTLPLNGRGHGHLIKSSQLCSLLINIKNYPVQANWKHALHQRWVKFKQSCEITWIA